MNAVRIGGWFMLILSTIVLVVFAVLRLADMTAQPPPIDAFGIRYAQHPWVALLHIIPGIAFLVLVPLQFVERIRRRNIRFHRWLGRVLAVCAAVSGIYALAAAFLFPAYAGIVTQSATVFYGVIYLVALAKAIHHIRRKRTRLHHEWMIRLVALAMGVATIRLYILIFTALMGFSFDEVFGASFWLGLSTNFVVAEIGINYARNRRPRPSRGSVAAGEVQQ